jgi:hypothetical protein
MAAAAAGVRLQELPAATTRGGDPMGSSESETTTDHDEIRRKASGEDSTFFKLVSR